MPSDSRKRVNCPICGLSYLRSTLYKHIRRHDEQNESMSRNVRARIEGEITTDGENTNNIGNVPLVELEEVEAAVSDAQITIDESQHDELHDDYQSSEDDSIAIQEDVTNDSQSDNEDSASTHSEAETDSDKLCTLISKFLVLWQTSNHISNAAMEPVLKFIKILVQIAGNVKLNVKSYKHLLKGVEEQFTKYVVCPKCNFVYEPDVQLSKLVEGRSVPTKCSHVAFPRHPKAHLRIKCGEELSEVVKRTNGDLVFKAKKIYCYRSISLSVSKLVCRPGFESACTHWQSRVTHENILSDIYDGRVWKSFVDKGYLEENDLALMLNLDFFQPCKHVKYSVGVIYLSIMNLPREERNKPANVIIVGIIPGPKEPPLNPFLEPMVDELLTSFNENGFSMTSHLSPDVPKKFRLFLICVACDIPALRSTCGFLGHSATLGCSKCLKKFQGDIGEKDYSGFDRQLWLPRTNEQHHRDVDIVCRLGKTKTGKEKLESEKGVRYSVLNELPYRDQIKDHAVDPMHGVFSGTGKKMNSDWVTDETLTKADCRKIQEIMDDFIVPSEVGRIPHKIRSGFSSFTADQWKNWINVFSMYALYDKVPVEQLECWRILVKASCLLCRKYIRISEVHELDDLFLKFCVAVERVYNWDYITPNMHMHGHLANCILDYGPVHVFWLFSFERYNGKLEQIKTNKRHIEPQLMKKYLLEIANCNSDGLESLNDLIPNNDELRKLLLDVQKKSNSNRGTLLLQTQKDIVSFMLMAEQTAQITNVDWSLDNSSSGMYQWKNPKHTFFNNMDASYLKSMYSYLYSNDELKVSKSVWKINRVMVNSCVIGCQETGSCRSSYILAHWCGLRNPENIVPNTELRPGKVKGLYLHNVFKNGVAKQHLLAKVEWFEKVTDDIQDMYGEPVKLFSPLTVIPGASCFVPVQRIFCKFASLFRRVNNTDVVVVCPLGRI